MKKKNKAKYEKIKNKLVKIASDMYKDKYYKYCGYNNFSINIIRKYYPVLSLGAVTKITYTKNKIITKTDRILYSDDTEFLNKAIKEIGKKNLIKYLIKE